MSRNEASKAFGLDPSQCLRLKRCWYGTCDAGHAFEFAVRDDFEVHNFSQGTTVLYGDDYVELAAAVVARGSS